MTPEEKLKLYSEQELVEMISYIDKVQHNVSALTNTVVAKVHDLNVSSKETITITKQEGLDILHGFILYSQILHQMGDWADNTIRQMAPSLRLAREIGPVFLKSLSDTQSTSIFHSPVTETPS